MNMKWSRLSAQKGEDGHCLFQNPNAATILLFLLLLLLCRAPKCPGGRSVINNNLCALMKIGWEARLAFLDSANKLSRLLTAWGTAYFFFSLSYLREMQMMVLDTLTPACLLDNPQQKPKETANTNFMRLAGFYREKENCRGRVEKKRK